MKMEEKKVIKDLETAIMCVNNLLTQEQFIVRDQVVNAMIQAINTIKEQNAQQDNWIFVGNNPSFSPFDGSGEYILVCPKCGYKTSKNTPYCPMCGNKNGVKE